MPPAVEEEPEYIERRLMEIGRRSGGDRGKTTPAVEGEPEAEQLWLRQVGGAQLDFLAHLHSEATDVLTECHSGALGSDTSARIQKH